MQRFKVKSAELSQGWLEDDLLTLDRGSRRALSILLDLFENVFHHLHLSLVVHGLVLLEIELLVAS